MFPQEPARKATARCTPSRDSMERLPNIPLPSDNDFPQMVAAQEEFHRLRLLKQTFEGTVIKILDLPGCVTRNQKKSLRILDAVVVQGQAGHLFVGAEKSQHHAAGPHDLHHALNELIEEWGHQELKRVPYECAVEMPLGEIEDLVEKALGAAGDSLVFKEIA